MEIWTSIEEYGGFYEVSNIGRVKRLRIIIDHGRWGGKTRAFKERILTPILGFNGYQSVALSVEGKVNRRYIHRLVAKAFIANPENRRTVNHKNGIKTDNAVDNLEWATDSENISHWYENSFIGNKTDRVIGYGVIQRGDNGDVVAVHKSIRAAARAVCGNYHSIRIACQCRDRKYRNYKWEYEPADHFIGSLFSP